jgi:hypothetical protein
MPPAAAAGGGGMPGVVSCCWSLALLLVRTDTGGATGAMTSVDMLATCEVTVVVLIVLSRFVRRGLCNVQTSLLAGIMVEIERGVLIIPNGSESGKSAVGEISPTYLSTRYFVLCYESHHRQQEWIANRGPRQHTQPGLIEKGLRYVRPERTTTDP